MYFLRKMFFLLLWQQLIIKKSTQFASLNNKRDKKNMKQDASIKQVLASSHKRTQVSEGLLLANYLEAVENELQERCL